MCWGKSETHSSIAGEMKQTVEVTVIKLRTIKEAVKLWLKERKRIAINICF